MQFVDLWWNIWDIYWIFLLLRVVLVLVPTNSGYLHPDEYFQTVEVVVGDVFQVETHRTWEFNVTAPLRSPTGEVKLTCHSELTNALRSSSLHPVRSAPDRPQVFQPLPSPPVRLEHRGALPPAAHP